MSIRPRIEGPRLRNLDLEIFYEGTGDTLLSRFVLPALTCALSYDRVTSFFSVGALSAIAQGVESLWRRGGHMRLILGVHDVPEDLLEAAIASDGLDELIAAVRTRLCEQVSNLRDEFTKERIATLAWMMQDSLLEVRVAAPTSTKGGSVGGVFHSKRYVLTDGEGSVVTAEGSPNETVMGLGSNFEELTVHMSWNDRAGYTKRHAESFERLWRGEHAGIQIRTLDQSFASQLLGALRPVHPRPTKRASIEGELSAVSRVIDAARRSPAFAAMNLGSSSLFPHQERAFVDAVSRWPLRALLADEVGLGKTLEAASVIAYAMRFCGVQRVTVFAPAGLVQQWQHELWEHFKLDFHRYDVAGRTFVSLHGDVRAVPRGQEIIGPYNPPLVIMSAQLARGDRIRGHLFSKTDYRPDLLVVDEAHAARNSRDPDGSRRPTLLRRMLQQIIPEIPHVLFLTATPMQIDPLEYYDLLSLLGMPEEWNEELFSRSLELLAAANTTPELQGVKSALTACRSSLMAFKPDLDRLQLSGPTQAFAARLTASEQQTSGSIVSARSNWKTLHSLTVASHPGHLLTIRNTRAALEELGYKFPERIFHAPALRPDELVRRFYAEVDSYLEGCFGGVEAAANPDRATGLGFMKSTYRQRLASSLRAAQRTLGNRLTRISKIQRGIAVSADPVTVEEDAEELEVLSAVDPSRVAAQLLEHACVLEAFHLETLLARLDSLGPALLMADPKLACTMEVIADHIERGDAVLIFSRYTDTVDACIDEYRARFPASSRAPFGKYVGGESWIDRGDYQQPVTKEGLRNALEAGEVSVIFCSDAASEGLNLQTARALINVDVPWNPARLEQRIGRIARLGQKSETVEIYNLWYPDSVEGRIYSRLLQRKDLYDLAVGEYPEIVSSAIKTELSARYQMHASPTDDPITVLQELRTSRQLDAIQRIWFRPGRHVSSTQRMREEIAAVIARSALVLGAEVSADGKSIDLNGRHWDLNTEAGLTGALNLTHDAVDILTRMRNAEPHGNSQLLLLVSGTTPLVFAIATGKERRLLSPSALPKLLEALVSAASLTLESNDVSGVMVDITFDAVADLVPWLPHHAALATIHKGSSPLSPYPSDLRVEEICNIESTIQCD